jgi:hypothetical protein
VLEFHVFPDVVLVCDFLPVFQDLGGVGVELAPFGVGFEAELVGVCRDI